MNKDFLNKDFSEIAQDQSFIDWVKGADVASSVSWEQWVNKHPQKAADIQSAKSMVQALVEKDKNLKAVENEVWAKIKEETIDSPMVRKRRVVKFRKYVTIAAVAASIILPMFIFFGDNNRIIRATHGEHIAYNFPDQSSAKLNSGSSLEYNPKKWNNGREVILKGEAFFDVEKGKSFEVVTHNGSVVVLGTSFNVLSRGNQFKVSCKTGRVEVRTEEHVLVLNPGESVALNSKTKRLEPTKDLNDDQVDWLQGQYHFENARLEDVFDEMERQFNVNIDVPNKIASSLFTGYFTAENMDTALYQVCWPMKLKSSFKNSKVIITEGITE